MNSNGTLYNTTSGLCNGCHSSSDGSHNFADISWPIRPVSGEAITGGSCAGGGNGCHTGGSNGAAGTISMSSPHTDKTRGTKAAGCTDCHPGNLKGAIHNKSGAATVIEIPNYSGIGINYANNTGSMQGFVLGGDITTATTEAEICWNCHDFSKNGAWNAGEPSEWGTNTDTNGALANYNFGSLTTFNWFTGYWSSANFTYKGGKLNDKPKLPKQAPTSTVNGGSTHTANPNADGPTVPGVDTAAQVRCSYCHQVHTGTDGDGTTVGAPYLRGTWQGNPYREDGAPRSGTAYPSQATFGMVPRGTTASTQYGGYQIDQNNGNPTSGWTVANSAGLCTVAACHGSTLGSINEFGTSGTDWVSGNNSHQAVVLTSPGGPYFNLYTELRRHPSSGQYTTTASLTTNYYRTAPWMADRQMTNATSGAGGYSFRSQDPAGFAMQPQMGSARPYGFGFFNWGVTIDNTTTQNNFHKFSCSKCHNPHASRLPRLLITNCLDTKVNTWEDSYAKTGATTYSTENQSVTITQLTTAQNCHRRRDPSFSKTWTGGPAMNADGWNNVSPW